jgi:hypothetical protein
VFVESTNDETPLSNNYTVLSEFFVPRLVANECWKIVESKRYKRIIVEFNSFERANKFLEYANLTPIDCVSYIPPHFVEVMGVLEHVPLGIDDEDLLKSVVRTTTEGVKVNYIKRLGKIVENGTRFQRFQTCAVYFQNTKTLPDGVFLLGNLFCRVREYKIKPKQCRKCCQYGHTRNKCQEEPMCGYCSEGHRTHTCVKHKKPAGENAPRCKHCQGAHEAYSKLCPSYIKERQKLNSRHPAGRFSIFEAPVKSQNRNKPTQRPSWPAVQSSNRWYALRPDDEPEATEGVEEANLETQSEATSTSRPRRRPANKPGRAYHEPAQPSSKNRTGRPMTVSREPRSSLSYADAATRKQRIKELVANKKSAMQESQPGSSGASNQNISSDVIAAIACEVVHAIFDEQMKIFRESIPLVVAEIISQLHQ